MNHIHMGQRKTGDSVQDFFLIKSAEGKITATGKRYLDMVLADQHGECSAKLWDCTPEDESRYSNNILVKVKGVLGEWQGRAQIKIEKLRPALPEDGLTLDDFVPSAPKPADQMYEELCGYISRITHKDLRGIVETIITAKRERLLYYPAAMRNHHAVRAGLLYHILTMLQAGSKLCEVYTALNRELLFAGIILHDMAKLEEMNASELGIVSEYTVEGELLGHIIQGIKSIDNAALQIGADPEVALLLQHMVFSHHYEAEYGSPKKPMLPEAELLHHLDIIDARLYDMTKVLAGLEPGQVSDKVWLLENRKLYKSVLQQAP